jgi:hypothetical protein
MMMTMKTIAPVDAVEKYSLQAFEYVKKHPTLHILTETKEYKELQQLSAKQKLAMIEDAMLPHLSDATTWLASLCTRMKLNWSQFSSKDQKTILIYMQLFCKCVSTVKKV